MKASAAPESLLIEVPIACEDALIQTFLTMITIQGLEERWSEVDTVTNTTRALSKIDISEQPQKRKSLTHQVYNWYPTYRYSIFHVSDGDSLEATGFISKLLTTVNVFKSTTVHDHFQS